MKIIDFNISKIFFIFAKQRKSKKMKKHNHLMEEKHKIIEEFLLNNKKLDKKEVKNEDKKNKNLTDLYLNSLKKVEELTKKMNNKKESFNFSFKTIFKHGTTDKKEIINPEFVTPCLFNIDDMDNLYTYENFNSTKNLSFGQPENINLNDLKTKIVEEQDFVIDPLNKNSSEYEFKEKFNYPTIRKMEEIDNKKACLKSTETKWMLTGIKGFDELLEKGIPVGSNIIVSGGPGTGKTIFCLQVIYNKALEGKDCVYLSMEERPERLKEHMQEFGFKVKEIKRGPDYIILSVDGKGKIALKRLQPIRLARSIEALLEKASGTLPVDINLVLDFIPKDFDAYLLVLDSISAIETAFSGTKRQYRIQIEQLFRYFEDMNITTFLITESSDVPQKFSSTGVEEFLSDGIIVFYNFQGVKKRARGVEIYKLRGASHSQRIVSMTITNKGVEVFPDVFCL